MPLTLRLRSTRTDSPEIAEAAHVVRQGGIVIFPTESVYGIGAGLDFPEAALRINRLKQRPETQPLLVHCAETGDIAILARAVPPETFRLIEAFLPGPLALILPAADRVPEELRGPGDTIGIRVTGLPVARALIRRSGMPLAGSSANRHGAPATGTFSGIDASLIAEADIVLDAGDSGDGMATTMVDLAARPFRVIREGAISRQAVEAVLVGPRGWRPHEPGL
ncbi:MAG TPA: threonylcarbamoyl-AMP synthase [candidate division WOR-3 bacterium]|uniref:L-threonylcarbamoyladenylate synthase n=1 Tax=candidate division WOR-3 bacterium TaxID=2052148 RepID=A0A7V0T5X3_UNCW3|nr:threonylcarbamoyl-AMP synthase [candidate division WOR-3 bacterium]